ncbi:matrix-remodeling-associated protein 7 isoform X2 [Alligator mississippiensis]|uniref:Matrix-remodeling-associated protein 7-like n=1 Tax=Alligator mississippiensis TaxID=8496 RepID=A0A151N6K9_ALLMI|nr:matrix-remodeling-associated protein 7 isoform X2 [Alligator mississippiensis]KYO32367.1 matrix-remodeling-associated protein 7-like [Alligator mississippiensis]
MAAQCRVLALMAAVGLVLAIAAADEPVSPPDTPPPPPADGQTPEPASPGKPEASGESVTPGSFGAAERSHTDDLTRDGLDTDSSSLDTLNSGSFNLEPLAGGAPGGPAVDVPAQSNESQESEDHDVDSEETLAPQGM